MKKLILALLLMVLGTSCLFSQKYAYVDSDYILDNIPEYKDAQNQLDELAAEFE